MSWARFDDKYTDHPKIVEAGPWSELLDMRAIIYCAAHETDGFIPKNALPKLGLGIPGVKSKAAKLVEVGRWDPALADSGWWVRNYLSYNPSRARKEKDRSEARDRMAKARCSGRTEPELPPNFGDCSDNPVPSPSPTREETISLSQREAISGHWGPLEEPVSFVAKSMHLEDAS